LRLLHGSWLTNFGDDRGAFALWAETNETRADADTHTCSSGRCHGQHPFVASVRDLRAALKDSSPQIGDLLSRDVKESAITLLLPSTRTAPQPSLEILRNENAPSGMLRVTLAQWCADALTFAPHNALDLLVSLPSDEETPHMIKIGADLRYWQVVAKFAFELLARQRIKPTLQKQDDKFLACWLPLLDEPSEQERLTRLLRAMPPICRAVFRREKDAKRDVPAARDLLDDFLTTTIDAFARWHAVFGLSPFPSHQTVAQAWLSALCDRNPTVKESAANLAAFYEQYRAWAEPVGAASGDTFRICFRLDPPQTADAEGIVTPKANSRDWSLRYLLQANDDPSLLISADAVWRERGSTLKFLNRKFDAPQERLLAGLGLASKMFPPIDTSLRAARPEACVLNVEQAYTFIRETAMVLQSSGFGVLVPGISSKLGVRVNLKSKKQSSQQKGGVASLTFDSVIEYDWQLALGGEPLSREEFERLASLKVPLVQVRGQWVEIRPDQIEQAIKFWEKQKGAGELSLQEALRLALSQEPAKANIGLPVTDVAAEGWIADLLEQLARGEKMQKIETPRKFQGTLRHYQSAGLSWLGFLRHWGPGACLADDMGLGKTPTTIALLLAERAQRKKIKPALVICPTSVVSNWERELSRFAPDLRVHIHHGAARKKTELTKQAAQSDVVLSSYALLHRDVEQLAQIKWGDVILDEAQNIKNPTTKQAQAARKIGAQAEWRAALTGTPVENRLTELWSIFQFLNSDYLGSQNDFYNRFAKPIECTNDADAAKRLKALVSPFILRRVKTDPNVISDLPQKNEMKVFCNLTKEQATLYEAVVRDSLKRIEESEGIERRGIVLATLMKLKQVCNHPAQFLGDGSALAGRSGKLARMTEMMEEVRAVKDRALVFTQFAEMGTLLKAYLQEAFGDEVLFLHGGVSAKARTKMIERFQDDPNGPLIFILSIKAGGTGLNLMRANHVFHFDRWWNPAVENQATDRAFRIGQTKNVQVHKYLCAGTFEEKINAMIERKKALAESIVGTSEAWITEMTTAQLKELFVLRREAIADE
jgi:SNF2 family DNA or RNA helicase